MTPYARLVLICAVILALGRGVRCQQPKADKNEVTIRSHQQKIYLYLAKGREHHRKILFAPGDGGCRGFAIAISEELAKAGHDAYCLDTRDYLESFTGPHVLSTTDIASDFGQIAQWVQQGVRERVLLVGWSEGAGLVLAAAADAANQALFDGVVAIGTPEDNVLAWHWSDIGASITHKVPHEPTFKSADFMAKVSPLPLFAIASTADEYISMEATRALYSAAREPKQLAIVKARDHKYSGNTDDFFRALRWGLNWIEQQQH